MSKEMKVLQIGEEQYEIVDEKARESINDIEQEGFETPNFPMLPCSGKSSPKFVYYNKNENELKVVQKSKAHYLIYTFNTKNGDTGSTSVGGNWDLLRLKSIELSQKAFGYKSNYGSVVGTLSTLSDHILTSNPVENSIITNSMIPEKGNPLVVNKNGIARFGLKSADATNPAYVQYKLKYTNNRKANILFYCNATAPESVDILINDVVIDTINLRAMRNGINTNYLYEFTIPFEILGTDTNKIIDVKIRNNDLINNMYFSCMNYIELKDYDGREIDSFKAKSSEIYYINSDGASDYAIYDNDEKKFMGSYHGGESLIKCEFIQPYYDDFNRQDFSSDMYKLYKTPTENRWFITPNFEIVQNTNLNSKGKMLSIFSFDQDGQIDMNFSFYDGNVNTTDFYTGLICNSKALDSIKYPNNAVINEDKTTLLPNDGMVYFSNRLNSQLKMHVGFSKFPSKYIKEEFKNGWIQNNANYNKFYYGAINGVETPVNVKNLAFRKTIICNFN